MDLAEEKKIASPKNAHDRCLAVVDVLFSTMILAPTIVMYWRGSWNLMGFVLFADEQLSAFASLTIGIVGHMFFILCQDQFAKSFHPDKHRITYLLFSRLYTYVYGIVCINGWRGGWMLFDIFIPLTMKIVLTITVISVIVLSVLKGLRNISVQPFVLATDNAKDYFLVPTRYKTGSKEPGRYILDCSFSVLVIGALVLLIWRGMWMLCELTIYTDDLTMSAWGSLAIGYGIVIIAFSLQSLMRWACEGLQGLWRVAFADVFIFFCFVGSINVWRGVWNLSDVYFLPDNKLMGDILSHSLSFLLLALLNCSNSILVRGVYIDAEEPAGKCVIIPVYSLVGYMDFPGDLLVFV